MKFYMEDLKMILHLLSSNKLSGAENLVADICMMFKNETSMIYCSPEGDIRDSLEARNVNYISIKKMSLKNIRKVIKQYQPEIIHAHDVKASIYAVLAKPKAKIISHLHGNDEKMRKLSFKSIAYNFISKKVFRIITVSKSVYSDYKFNQNIKGKYVNLVNVIYPDRINILKNINNLEYKFDFLYLGRLSYPKDPERLAKIASSVLMKMPNVRFGVVGYGPYSKKMEEIFSDFNVIDRVVFTGNVSNPYTILEKAKCLLMASKYEGMPIVSLESMYLGLPIVSTPTDGMKDLIVNDYNGFTSDNDDVLVQKIINILTDSNLHKKLSSNCIREFHNRNDFTKYKETLKNLYNDNSKYK
jgi:glycosyltransferase involved in cell wall biosynthesis